MLFTFSRLSIAADALLKAGRRRGKSNLDVTGEEEP